MDELQNQKTIFLSTQKRVMQLNQLSKDKLLH